MFRQSFDTLGDAAFRLVRELRLFDGELGLASLDTFSSLLRRKLSMVLILAQNLLITIRIYLP